MTAPDVVASDLTQLSVVEIDPGRDERWERFVSHHPNRLVFHHAAYLDAIARGYGDEPASLACLDERGHVCGVLPLMWTRRLRGQGALMSLPHTLAAGPLSTHRDAVEALLRAATERAARRQAGVEVDVMDGDLSCSPSALRRHDGVVTYVVDLPQSPQDLRFGNSRNHSAIKRAVKKAEHHGVTVRDATTEGDLRAWYELYLVTMRHHAAPPRPYSFFHACWHLLGPRGMMRLLLAEQDGGGTRLLLAGCFYLQAGRTVSFVFNGRRSAHLAARPNDAIHWRALHDACAAGFRRYDFGPVAELDSGLAHFKLKWGARPLSIHRYGSAMPADAGRLRHGSPARTLLTAAWRRLPLPATVVAGTAIHRYLYSR